jgi:hypothetical protein
MISNYIFYVYFYSKSQTKCSRDGIRLYAGYLEQDSRTQKYIIFIQFF